jgi:hypothetical protein
MSRTPFLAGWYFYYSTRCLRDRQLLDDIENISGISGWVVTMSAAFFIPPFTKGGRGGISGRDYAISAF